MKPIKLIMRAFGPYADEQEIDFTKLGDNNFFLIHGPTGAGKTTILDAITFALYGTPSGDLRESKALRSDYAPANRKTEVEFTFQNGEKIYKILRSPEQEAAKQRGEGTRKLPAAAALYHLHDDGSADVLAAKSDEATKIITQLMGFKAEQFRQIVLLPQGEFRRFLIAESKDRKAILETIFKTELYRRIENILGDRSQEIRKTYEDCKNRQQFLLDSTGCENAEAIQNKIADLTAEADSCQQQIAAKNIQLELERLKLQQAQTIAAAFEEYAQASAEHERLLKQKDAMAELAQTIDAAEQAAILEPVYSATNKAYQQCKAAQDEKQRAAQNLADAQKQSAQLAAALKQELAGMELAGKLKDSSDVNAVLATLNQHILDITAQSTALTASSQQLQKLASQLIDGEPCPVCGSTHHPHPANITAQQKGELEAQAAALKAKIDRLQRLQKDYQSYTLMLAKLETQAQAAAGHAQQAQESFDAQQQEFAAKINASVFKGDRTAFKNAMHNVPRKAVMQQQMQSYHEQLAAAASRKSRAQSAIDGKECPDIAAQQEAARVLEAEVRQLTTQAALLKQQAENLHGTLKELQSTQKKMSELEASYRTAANLSETAKGNNSLKLTFSGFVLQAILDDVLTAANQRLNIMSRSRYSLARAAGVSDARRENGLNIEVTDTFTGAARPVKTLSGGEIFLASLSLALGLSDVVQSYAGGIRLDTILIDEGFGSLDSESLDMAINTLMDLQRGGRLVGIISHVAELKERIHARLEVIPGQRGSSAMLHV